MTTRMNVNTQEKYVPSMAFLGKSISKPTKSKLPKNSPNNNALALIDVFVKGEVEHFTVKELVVSYNKFAVLLHEPTLNSFANKPRAIKRCIAFAKILKQTQERKTATKSEKKPTTKATNKAMKQPTKKTDKTAKRFSFGKKVSVEEVEFMIRSVFGDTFVVTNVRFVDEHYWYCNLKFKSNKAVVKKIRVDYLVNYLRIPREFKNERKEILATVARIQKDKS